MTASNRRAITPSHRQTTINHMLIGSARVYTSQIPAFLQSRREIVENFGGVYHRRIPFGVELVQNESRLREYCGVGSYLLVLSSRCMSDKILHWPGCPGLGKQNRGPLVTIPPGLTLISTPKLTNSSTNPVAIVTCSAVISELGVMHSSGGSKKFIEQPSLKSFQDSIGNSHHNNCKWVGLGPSAV
jgi:hypothetical protein